ncbi:MAG: hypothetical protein JOZ31_18465 [Verrucomicrobia bacterium]|nr:hypothetical protein [Verrucomicrobiota bacterium]
MSDSDWLSDEESFALLKRMFPGGLRSADLLTALCPEGWQNSSFKSLLEGESLVEEGKTEADRLGYLVGLCLWDALSDNHDLILPEGRLAHLGSFRATAGIISDFFHSASLDASWGDEGYLDFYMGTWSIMDRTALKPIYRYIFERLQEAGFDWKYSFSRLYIIRFEKQENQSKETCENYDPSSSFVAEQKEREEAEEFARSQEELEKLHRASLEEARSRPPPATVQAYFEVFGKWPLGWPPWACWESGFAAEVNRAKLAAEAAL